MANSDAASPRTDGPSSSDLKGLAADGKATNALAPGAGATRAIVVGCAAVLKVAAFKNLRTAAP